MNYRDITPCVTPTGSLNMLRVKECPSKWLSFRTCVHPQKALVAKVNQEFFPDFGGCGQIWQNPPSSKAIPNSFCLMHFGSILRSRFFFGISIAWFVAHALNCDIQSYDFIDFSNSGEYFSVSGWWNTWHAVQYSKLHWYCAILTYTWWLGWGWIGQRWQV